MRVVERHPDFGRAQIVRILEPGPGRREAPCPHFERCGGCDLQHLDDERQSLLKAQAAIETLRRLGRLERLPEARLVRGRAWGYRLRAQVRTELANERVLVGYFERGSHTLVPIRVCPILLPDLEAAVTGLPAVLGADAPRRVDLAVGDGGQVTAAPPLEALQRGSIARRVGRFDLRARRARLLPGARRAARRSAARGVRPRVAASSRSTSTPASGSSRCRSRRRYRQVIAVESDRVAARFAVRNARANGCDNVEVVSLSVESLGAARCRPGSIAWWSILRAPGCRARCAARWSSTRVPRAHLRVVPPGDARARPARPGRGLLDPPHSRCSTCFPRPATSRRWSSSRRSRRSRRLRETRRDGGRRTRRARDGAPRPGGARPATNDRGRPRSTDRPRWERRDRPRPESTDRPPSPRRDRPQPTDRPRSAPRDRARPGLHGSPAVAARTDRARSTDRRRPPAAAPRPAGRPRTDDGNRRPPRDRPRPPRTKR